MRYVGQSYELSIPFGDGKVEDGLEAMLKDFHDEHERAYGFAAPGEPVEFVTLRLTAVGRIAKPKLPELPAGRRDVEAARRAVRQVYFAEAGGFVDCPSYDRYRLPAGGVIEGPAIVEEMDSTTVIPPGLSRRSGSVRQPARQNRRSGRRAHRAPCFRRGPVPVLPRTPAAQPTGEMRRLA